MKKFFLFLLAIFFTAPLFSCLPAGRVHAQIQSPEKLFYVSSSNLTEAIKSINANWQKIDVIAPQMFSVGYDFLIKGKMNAGLAKTISAHNIKTMPLIVNANFSQTLMHNFLLQQKKQDDVITGLVYIAKKNNYMGWQFDFEHINYQDKDLYTAFVKKAYSVLKANNLQLSVAVVTRTKDFDDTDAFRNWGGAYDYKQIADNSDFISLMTYDDPNSVGPVASLDFTQKSLDYVKEKIPPAKLSLGVPLYYWKWKEGVDTKIGSGSYKNVLAIMANYRHSTGFSDTLGSSWLSYTFNNILYKIWFEDKNSVAKKMDVVVQNNLRGISAWVLGGEDPGIWKILKATDKSLAKK